MTEINRILAALDAAPRQPATLATLVQVEGSSYRRPGARLLLLPDGTRVGSISGGCLDEDVLERAACVLASGEPELACYDTTEENDLLWGVGTGCEGTVQIFLERIPAERPTWVDVLRRNQQQRRETAIEVNFAGTALQARGTSETRSVVEAGSTPQTNHLSRSRGPRLPLSSTAFAANEGGIFRETIPAPPALIICGAGDDAMPLLRMAKETGWHVTIADTRPAYATAQRFREADRVLSGGVEEIVSQLPVDARTFAAIMTHRFEDDAKFLRALLASDVRYLGQLGARKRTERLLAKLKTDGVTFSAAQLMRLHAPVGLDLGGSSPETVALSILAEMHARLAGRTPGNLRDRIAPIHG